jgi:hypothetical protein
VAAAKFVVRHKSRAAGGVVPAASGWGLDVRPTRSERPVR